jgi:hypothetical protein
MNIFFDVKSHPKGIRKREFRDGCHDNQSKWHKERTSPALGTRV